MELTSIAAHSPNVNIRPAVASGHVRALPRKFGKVRPRTSTRTPMGPHRRAGFDSSTIVDAEKCTVVGHDDFASRIENGRSRCTHCVDLAIDQRRTAVVNECRKSADSHGNVGEEAAAEQGTPAEVVDTV